MKNAIVFLALTSLLASAALAQCPDQTGVWSSLADSNPDFPMIEGRASEGWCNGNSGDPGNTVNMLSWDGAELATEWQFFDMAIDAAGPQLVFDGVTDGNGVQIYQINFDGGRFVLDGAAWMADGVDRMGDVFDYTAVLTITYVDGEMVTAVSNVTCSGMFDGCPDSNDCTLTLTGNTAMFWQTGSDLPMPMDFPAFLCGATDGALHNVSATTVDIACVVATESRSWSEIKALHD